MDKIKIINLTNHYDVWGDSQDGWQVNDSFHTDINEIIPDTNEAIFLWLRDKGYINLYCQLCDLEFIDNIDCIYINDIEQSHMPLFTIWVERD